MRIIRQVGKSLEITTNAYKVHMVAMPQNMDEFLGLIEKENPHVKIEMVEEKRSAKIPSVFIIILSSLGLKLLVQVQRSVHLYGLVRRRSKFRRRRIQGVGCILNPSGCSSCCRSMHRRKLVQSEVEATIDFFIE